MLLASLTRPIPYPPLSRSLWQRVRQNFEPSVPGPTLVNDGSVFVALGLWAAWTATASDPTLALGAALAFCAWRLYDKRNKRNPGGGWGCLRVGGWEGGGVAHSGCALASLDVAPRGQLVSRITPHSRCFCRWAFLGRQPDLGCSGRHRGSAGGRQRRLLRPCQRE